MGSKQHILIAEDNEDSRAMLRTFLELKGYRVLRSPRRRRKRLRLRGLGEQPDLIIIDLNMKLGGIALPLSKFGNSTS